MKKVFCIILAALMCISLAACSGEANNPTGEIGTNTTNASENIGSNDEFFIWRREQITGLTEEGMRQTSLVIPANCEAVSGIRENDTLVSISFENPKTEIKSGAFKDCTKLKNVVLPAGMREIPSNAFNGCTSLETIVIPEGITVIEYDAFIHCAGLKSIIIPEGVTEIQDCAFQDCTALEKIELPTTVKTIGNSTFQGCEALREVTFHTGLESIGNCAFENCNSLTVIHLPEGLKSLGDRSLADCADLEELYLPASLEDVSKTAISQIHNITVYVVADSYMDEHFEEMMGFDFFTKKYK